MAVVQTCRLKIIIHVLTVLARERARRFSFPDCVLPSIRVLKLKSAEGCASRTRKDLAHGARRGPQGCPACCAGP